MSTNDFEDSPRGGEQFPVPPTDPATIRPDATRPQVRPETERLATGQRPTGIETDGHHAPQSASGDAPAATDRAKDLAAEGQHSAGEVMDSAKREASMVAEQARDKASHLLGEVGEDLRIHASDQQRKVASNLRDISDEFRQMLDSSQASGTASTLVDQAAHHAGQAADWLEAREPGDLLDEVKDFARRKPMAFLGVALGAGLLAGRITRNASGSQGSADGTPAVPPTSPAASPAAHVNAPPPPATEVDPLPPNQGGTIQTGGVGGVGGSGLDPAVSDPGTSYPSTTPRRPNYE